METTIDEIAPDIFRLSTLVPEVAPGGFSFNQFLVRDDEPFLFHTGMRQLYPLVSAAVSSIVPLDDLRWISFAHVEADECGAMNQFLADAPKAEVVHGGLAVMVSLGDLADRPPRAMADGEVLDIGGHRLRFIPTPHVPHGWESGLWFDETTRTLFSGDVFTQIGDVPAVTEDDIVDAALEAEALFRQHVVRPEPHPDPERARRPRADDARHHARVVATAATAARSSGRLAAGYAATIAERS